MPFDIPVSLAERYLVRMEHDKMITRSVPVPMEDSACTAIPFRYSLSYPMHSIAV